jgi:ferredoxin-thioredoxin reductase catalytic subunit
VESSATLHSTPQTHIPVKLDQGLVQNYKLYGTICCICRHHCDHIKIDFDWILISKQLIIYIEH